MNAGSHVAISNPTITKTSNTSATIIHRRFQGDRAGCPVGIEGWSFVI
jgi:hypothetical protein